MVCSALARESSPPSPICLTAEWSRAVGRTACTVHRETRTRKGNREAQHRHDVGSSQRTSRSPECHRVRPLPGDKRHAGGLQTSSERALGALGARARVQEEKKPGRRTWDTGRCVSGNDMKQGHELRGEGSARPPRPSGSAGARLCTRDQALHLLLIPFLAVWVPPTPQGLKQKDCIKTSKELSE